MFLLEQRLLDQMTSRGLFHSVILWTERGDFGYKQRKRRWNWGIISTLGQHLSCFAVVDSFLASPVICYRRIKQLLVQRKQALRNTEAPERHSRGQLPAAYHEAACSISSGRPGRNSAWNEHGWTVNKWSVFACMRVPHEAWYYLRTTLSCFAWCSQKSECDGSK